MTACFANPILDPEAFVRAIRCGVEAYAGPGWEYPALLGGLVVAVALFLLAGGWVLYGRRG